LAAYEDESWHGHGFQKLTLEATTGAVTMRVKSLLQIVSFLCEIIAK
jgi:hypothetical protein